MGFLFIRSLLIAVATIVRRVDGPQADVASVYSQIVFARPTVYQKPDALKWQKMKKLSSRHLAFFRLLLLVAGDVESNPGPVNWDLYTTEFLQRLLAYLKLYEPFYVISPARLDVIADLGTCDPTLVDYYLANADKVPPVPSKSAEMEPVVESDGKFYCGLSPMNHPMKKGYTRSDNVRRHVKAMHKWKQSTTNKCQKCGGRFEAGNTFKEHDEQCQGVFCSPCGKHFARHDNYSRHVQSEVHKQRIESRKHIPVKRPSDSEPVQPLRKKPRQQRNVSFMDPATPIFEEGDDEEMKAIYRQNWRHIRTYYHQGDKQNIYNIRTNDYLQDVNFHVDNMFQLMDGVPFKVNVELGFMLIHKIDRRIRHYYSSQNTSEQLELLDRPMVIHDAKRLDDLKRELRNISPEYMTSKRPDSEWQFERLTNLTLKITPLRDYAMVGMMDGEAHEGSQSPPPQDERIREFVRTRRCIKALTMDKRHRAPYVGKNLCFFRCAAFVKIRVQEEYARRGLNDLAQELFTAWAHATGRNSDIEAFEGVDLRDIRELEDILQLNICVFELYSRITQELADDTDEDDVEAQIIAEDVEDEQRAANRRDRMNQELIANAQEQGFLDHLAFEDVAPSGRPSVRRQLFQDEPGPSWRQDSAEGEPEDPHTTTSSPQDTSTSSDESEDDEGDDISARIIRRSMNNHKIRLNLLLFDSHFYYVTNVSALAKSWRCQRCSKYFRLLSYCKKHQRVCTDNIKKIYPGGSYQLPPTVFGRLRLLGYQIDDGFYEHRILYDFEARIKPLEYDPEAKTKYINEQVPMSVSVISTLNEVDKDGVPYDQARFFTHPDPAKLVETFYDYIVEIADRIGSLKKEQHEPELRFMEEKMQVVKEAERLLKASKDDKESADYKKAKNMLYASRDIILTNKALKRWIGQVPVIGFNSGKYDFNLIRQYLLPYIHSLEVKKQTKKIIMRGHDFLTFATENLVFLDMMHYLPPGFSLEKFVTCFHPDPGDMVKGIFPYEYMTDYEKLAETELPPKDAFYSSLKCTGITDDQYATLQRLWQEKGWNTLRDMLEWYNNLDVEPFKEAVQGMFQLFWEMEIDMFKHGAISLPGVAMRRMFRKTTEDIVILFDERNKEWHEKLKANMVGGPAIAFTRYASPFTNIRDGPHKCKSIVGVDANSLYLSETGKDMPTGIPIIYRPDDDTGESVPVNPVDSTTAAEIEGQITTNMFKEWKHSVSCISIAEIAYVHTVIDQVAAENPDRRIYAFSRYFGGQKCLISRDGQHRMYLDGWIPELRIAIEYHGCYYHGHQCPLTTYLGKSENVRNKREEDLRLKRERHQQRMARLRELQEDGVIDKIIETYECELLHNLDKELKDGFNYWQNTLCRRLEPGFFGNTFPARKWTNDLIDGVKDGNFFGVLEVDMQVPWWIDGQRKEHEELPPIFKNIEIGIHDIGDFMAERAKELGALSQKRRSLISSYHATKTVVITPLLRYLMSIGVRVTRVYGAMEFLPSPKFYFITREVYEARKKAEEDGTQHAKAKGQVMKLIGNASYGKTITNLDKHHRVVLLDSRETDAAINSPCFRKLEQVTKDLYLVMMAKTTVAYNLPLQIGFFVYGYAKLSMLRFYREFLLGVIGRENFELMYMDTDSFYLALTKESITAFEHRLGYSEWMESEATKMIPGYFKVEYEGKVMVVLNAKTYYVHFDSHHPAKSSTKGVSKKMNEFKMPEFGAALRGDGIKSGKNTGLRVRDGHIVQYEASRVALTNLYLKRKVIGPKGHKTTPLDL